MENDKLKERFNLLMSQLMEKGNITEKFRNLKFINN